MMSDGNGIVKIDLDKVDWRGSREFFESLTAALEKLDVKEESYDFTWVGKRKAIIEAGAPINKTFRPDVAASKDWDTTENLFIEGDNLDALKLLQESYLGKVKMIYIDPPYNTGKDFVYHDNFKASTEQYDEDTEYKDETGNIQFKKNEKSNGRYHSDWLSMMYPRLKLARNLLADDGVIFLSIDDNEQANLKKLCDEIFGEDNFVADFIWKRGGGRQDSKHVAIVTEHVLCYSRNLTSAEIGEQTKENEAYPKFDEQKQKKYKTQLLRKWGSNSRREDRPNLYYPIPAPDGTQLFPRLGAGDGCWRWGSAKMKDEIASGNVEFVLDEKTNQWVAYEKIYEGERNTKKYTTIIDSISSSKGTKDLKELMDGDYFDYPKPADLMYYFINMVEDENALVLDFFSGSGTTAHAVMQLNAEDSGSRKWIMVQLPEGIDEKSEAYKAGYKTIPEISRERIRRAGDMIAAEHPGAKVDYGFRALTIADTNYKDVYRPAGQLHQADLLADVDNVKEDLTDIDLLYGVLTQSALELNRPISTTEIDGATIYQYDYFDKVSGLIACFTKDVPEEAIKAIAALKPLTAVFRDSSFANSQAKVNLSEHFRILSPDTKVKVI